LHAEIALVLGGKLKHRGNDIERETHEKNDLRFAVISKMKRLLQTNPVEAYLERESVASSPLVGSLRGRLCRPKAFALQSPHRSKNSSECVKSVKPCLRAI
jgi:hypothetical protein